MSEGGRRRRWLIYVVVAAAVVLVVGYLALGHSKPADQPFGANDPSSQIPTVTVMQPGSHTIVRDISATGTIAARREMQVRVAGEGGRVTRVLVDSATWDTAGQAIGTAACRERVCH